MEHKPPKKIPMELHVWRQAEEIIKEINEDVDCNEEDHEWRVYLLEELLETLEGHQKYLIPADASSSLREWMQD